MTNEQFEDYLRAGENTCIEFKRCGNGPQLDLYETYCSFLNRDGGDLFLGVEDNGTVVGIPKKSADSFIKNLIKVMNDRNLLEPTFYILPECIEYNGKTVIHLHVPCSSAVHRFKGVCYDRVFDADVKVTATEQIAMMYLRKQNIYTEQKVYKYVTMNELREDLFPIVRQMALSRNPEHPWRNLSDLDLLKSSGLYRMDFANNAYGISVAGVLLFGKDDVIRSIFPAYKTDALLRRVNLDRYDDRLTVRTNLIEAYTQLVQFGEKWLPDRFYLENDISVSLRNRILREAIGNLLIHREFSSSYTARFIIEEDQIIADNASRSLHQGAITLNNLCPQAKNPLIASFFKEIGRADELGSGVRNLYRFVRLYSGGEPTFIENDVFKLTIPLPMELSMSGKVHAVHETLADYYGQAPERDWQAPERKSKSLDTLILKELREDNTLSRGELLKRIPNVTEMQIRFAISKMQAAGRLVHVGPKKGGHWEILF